MKNKIAEYISYSIILLFVYAATMKLFDLKEFIKQINIQPFPDALTPLIIGFILVGEIVSSLLLMTINYRKLGFISSTIVMLAFTIYTSLIVGGYYNEHPCGCGGVIETLTWAQHLVVNIVFLTLSVLGWLLSEQRNRNSKVKPAQFQTTSK